MNPEVVGVNLHYFHSEAPAQHPGALRVVTLGPDECAELGVPAGSLKLATLDHDEAHRLVILSPDTVRALARLVPQG